MTLGPNQTKWIEALESGDYKQDTGWLKTDKGHCCLGVAEEVFNGKKTWTSSRIIKCGLEERRIFRSGENNEGVASLEIINKLGLYNEEGAKADNGILKSLSSLNDNGMTFKEIAKMLRDYPEDYFTEVV